MIVKGLVTVLFQRFTMICMRLILIENGMIFINTLVCIGYPDNFFIAGIGGINSDSRHQRRTRSLATKRRRNF